MKYLLISFVSVFVFSCVSLPTTKGKYTPYTKTIENSYFSNIKTDYVYKAKIELSNNKLGGLLIVKKIKKTHHRVVFTTEFGNKIFDFEFVNNNFKINFILDKLDKRIVINALKKDFQLLVHEFNPSFENYITSNQIVYKTKLNKKDNYYFFKEKKLIKIVLASKRKKKLTINFNDVSHNIAKDILLTHHNFAMKIQLNYIN